jgi:hypothetical protein
MKCLSTVFLSKKEIFSDRLEGKIQVEHPEKTLMNGFIFVLDASLL